MLLNATNYRKGFLVDEDLMAGISEDPEKPGRYVAFVLHPATGEYVGFQEFTDLEAALGALNGIPRNWAFEATSSGCGGKCAGKGSCAGGAGACGIGSGCATGACGPTGGA